MCLSVYAYLYYWAALSLSSHLISILYVYEQYTFSLGSSSNYGYCVTRLFQCITGGFVSRCDPHGRFTIHYKYSDDTGGAAHSCAAGHTTYDNKF